MIQHTNAVLAKIREIPALASKTYAVIVPKDSNGAFPTRPYVAVYPADGIDTQSSFTGPRSTQHPRFTLHIVGSSYDNVATVTALVKAKFVVNGFGVAPAVAGERTWGLIWSTPQPVQLDDDTVPPIPYQVIELAFDTEPIPA